MITANDGTQFDPDVLPMRLEYDGAGNLAYLEVIYSGTTYRQCFEYDGQNRLTRIGKWGKA